MLLVRLNIFTCPQLHHFYLSKCLWCYHNKLLDNMALETIKKCGFRKAFCQWLIISSAQSVFCLCSLRESVQISSRCCSHLTRPICMCAGQEPSTLCVPTWRWARNLRYRHMSHFFKLLPHAANRNNARLR